MKQFTGTLQSFDGPVWGHFVWVPLEIRNYFTEKKIKRVIATVNEMHSWHCAILSFGDGEKYYFLIGKEVRDKCKLKIGDKISVKVEEDKSKYGMPIPEEMEELLKQDPEGDDLFHKLTPGKQRSLLYLVAKPKSENVRLRKALAIIDHLKLNNGHLDFKQLNEEMKIKK